MSYKILQPSEITQMKANVPCAQGASELKLLNSIGCRVSKMEWEAKLEEILFKKPGKFTGG